MRDTGGAAGADGDGAGAGKPAGRYAQSHELAGEFGWKLPGIQVHYLSSWVTDRTIGYASRGELAGFDRLSGDLDWSLTPPKLQGWTEETANPQFCGASSAHEGSLVAVTYGAAKPEEDAEDGGAEDGGAEDNGGGDDGADDNGSGGEEADEGAENEGGADGEDGADGENGDTDYMAGVPRCAGLALVDIDAGEVVWSTTMIGPEDAAFNLPTDPHPEIVGDMIAVKMGGHVRAFTVADGEERWQARSISSTRDQCSPNDLRVAGAQFVAVLSCSLGGEPFAVVTLDPASGDEVDRVDLSLEAIGAEPLVPTIISTDPMVLLTNARDAPRRYLVVTEQGEAPVKIVAEEPEELDDPSEALDTRSVGGVVSGTYERYRTVVTDELLVTVTMEHDGSNKLVAYELATGERAWTTEAPDENTLLFPVEDVEDAIMAVTSSTDDENLPPVAVYDVAPADGKLTEVAGGYSDGGVSRAIRYATLHYHLGRIYVVNHGSPEEAVGLVYALH